MRGLGVQQNYTEALKWFTKSARLGDATGQSALGAMYANGMGVQQNYAEAAKWFSKAAKQGDPAAQTNLANLCKQIKCQ